MDKWEYCEFQPTVNDITDENTKMSETLEELGEQGWELAAPLTCNGYTRKLVFKRMRMTESSQEQEQKIER